MLSSTQTAYLKKLSSLLENFKKAADELNEHFSDDHNNDIYINEYIAPYYPSELPSFDELAASLPEWVHQTAEAIKKATE
jgi:hypothetical protein